MLLLNENEGVVDVQDGRGCDICGKCGLCLVVHLFEFGEASICYECIMKVFVSRLTADLKVHEWPPVDPGEPCSAGDC